MKKTRVILLSVLLMLIAFLAGSYIVSIKKESQEKLELEQEKLELEMELLEYKYLQGEESKLDTCLQQAETSKHNLWLKSCEHRGSNIERDDENEITDCWLPTDLAEEIKEGAQTDKDNCFRRYGK
ncbi:hypothetical protein ACFLZ4_01930 [Patescibacteria group bacterium]